jgi:hypothetical protein
MIFFLPGSMASVSNVVRWSKLTIVAVEPAATVTEEDLAASSADVRQVLIDHDFTSQRLLCFAAPPSATPHPSRTTT